MPGPMSGGSGNAAPLGADVLTQRANGEWSLLVRIERLVGGCARSKVGQKR